MAKPGAMGQEVPQSTGRTGAPWVSQRVSVPTSIIVQTLARGGQCQNTPASNVFLKKVLQSNSPPVSFALRFAYS